MKLAELGILGEADAVQMGRSFFAAISTLVFKYLLNGAFTQERKDAFRAESHVYVNTIIKQLGKMENV